MPLCRYRHPSHAVAGRCRYGYFAEIQHRLGREDSGDEVLIYTQTPDEEPGKALRLDQAPEVWPVMAIAVMPIHNAEDLQRWADGVLTLAEEMRCEHGETEAILPSEHHYRAVNDLVIRRHQKL